MDAEIDGPEARAEGVIRVYNSSKDAATCSVVLVRGAAQGFSLLGEDGGGVTSLDVPLDGDGARDVVVRCSRPATGRDPVTASVSCKTTALCRSVVVVIVRPPSDDAPPAAAATAVLGASSKGNTRGRMGKAGPSARTGMSVAQRMESRQRALRAKKAERQAARADAAGTAPAGAEGRRHRGAAAGPRRAGGAKAAPSAPETEAAGSADPAPGKAQAAAGRGGGSDDRGAALSAQAVGLACLLNTVLSDAGAEEGSIAAAGGAVDVESIMRQSADAIREAGARGTGDRGAALAKVHRRTGAKTAKTAKPVAVLGCMQGRGAVGAGRHGGDGAAGVAPRGEARGASSSSSSSSSGARARVSTRVSGRRDVTWRSQGVAEESAFFDGALAFWRDEAGAVTSSGAAGGAGGAPSREGGSRSDEEALLSSRLEGGGMGHDGGESVTGSLGDGEDGGDGPGTGGALTPAEEATLARANAARQRAFALWCSDLVQATRTAVEGEVGCGGIAAREERDLNSDLSLQAAVTDTLVQFHPAWLRLGLETMTGQRVPLSPSCLADGGVGALRRFLRARVLGPDAALAAKFAGTVKGVFDKEHARAQAAAALSRVLVLVHFLDLAFDRQVMGAAAPPRLFRRDAECKSTADVLVAVGRDLLARESNPVAHIRSLGVSASAQQQPVDEARLAVRDLRSDLRDGVVLARLLETLTHARPGSVARGLRWPCVTQLNRRSNLRVLLRGAEDAGIDVGGGRPLDDVAVAVSKGDLEATLALVWTMVGTLAVPRLAPREDVRLELAELAGGSAAARRTLETAAAAAAGAGAGARAEGPAACAELAGRALDAVEASAAPASGGGLTAGERRIALWVACAAAAGTGVAPTSVHGTAAAWGRDLSDGRALLSLVGLYRPWMGVGEPDVGEGTSTARGTGRLAATEPGRLRGPQPPSSGQDAWRSMLRAERAAMTRLCLAAASLGGVPLVLPSSNSGRPADGRVLALFASHLFSRLVLEGSPRTHRAAAVLQRAVRGRILLRSRLPLLARAAALRRAGAARRGPRVIRRALGAWIARRAEAADLRRAAAADRIRAWRYGMCTRAVIADRVLMKKLLRRGLRVRAGTVLRAREETAAVTATRLQAWWRCRAAAAAFVRARGAAAVVGRAARCAAARREALSRRRAAAAIHGAWRTRCVRAAFLAVRGDVVSFQAAVRGAQARERLRGLHLAATTIKVGLLRRMRDREEAADAREAAEQAAEAAARAEREAAARAEAAASASASAAAAPQSAPATPPRPPHPAQALVDALRRASSPAAVTAAADAIAASAGSRGAEALAARGALPALLTGVRACQRSDSHGPAATACLLAALAVASCPRGRAALGRAQEGPAVIVSVIENFRDRRAVAEPAVLLLAALSADEHGRARLSSGGDLLRRLSAACSAVRQRAKAAGGGAGARETARELSKALASLKRKLLADAAATDE